MLRWSDVPNKSVNISTSDDIRIVCTPHILTSGRELGGGEFPVKPLYRNGQLQSAVVLSDIIQKW